MYDYLIIGQGLAGTILSHTLIKAGYKTLVLNSYDPQSSSYIAAGIFSPITGQRVSKIAQAERYISCALECYKELEQLLNTRFLYEIPYIKVAVDQKLDHYISTRITDKAYRDLIVPHTFIHNSTQYKSIIIKQAGYINTTTLLDTYRAHLISINAYHEELFNEDKLYIKDGHISYNNIQAKQLIFCNGLLAAHNRFFNHLKFNPTKGQILTIHMLANIDHIVSGNVFLLPIGNNLFHVGATYERNFTDALPTQEGLTWLTTELSKIITEPYEIIDHKAGIRPTTFGHQPFVQWHQTYKNIGIFSGFGSKGVTLIPYLAFAFANHKLPSFVKASA